jgi:hypothetical protein
VRELDDGHSDRPRHARHAGADAHTRVRGHAHDGPKHAVQHDLKLKMLLDPEARRAAHLSAQRKVDVANRWPTDADLHEIAKHASQSETGLDISEQEIYDYLSRVALGSEKLDDLFSDEAIIPIPLFATANLLLTFSPGEKHWWEYLDQIWDAAEAADRIPITVLPALTLRAHREQA